jgi:anti-anti-sigma factor
MTDRSSELSVEMYRRLYRLIKRQIDPRRIAATLNIPIRTVLNIMNRLENAPDPEDVDGITHSKDPQTDFIDFYHYQKTRYSVLQLVGTLTERNSDLLAKELQRVFTSSGKALAIRLTDVTSIDEAGCQILLSFFQDFKSHGKFMALLDPSQELEPLLAKYNLEENIPVFGTERAFEDAAFARKSDLPESKK